MPRSKRDKKVSLTRTSKHGMEWKKEMVENIKTKAEDATGIYAFEVVGMRTAGIRELRRRWRESTICLGKNKIMALALGKNAEAELKENLHKVASRLTGSCGLLITKESEADVVKFFENFAEWDYARQGNKATETVVLEEGKLTQFSHAMEPHLRSLGLPTSLQKGIITLVKEYVVCKKGQILNANQAKILKLLEKPMAEFRIVLDSVWLAPDEFRVYPRVSEEVDENEDVDEIEDIDEMDEATQVTEDDDDE